MKTVDEFQDWLTKFDSNNFDDLGKMSALLFAGIKRGSEITNKDCDLNADFILDLPLSEPDKFSELTSMLAQSMQREVPEAKKKEVKLKKLPGTK